MKKIKIFFLQPPSPAFADIDREFAGGFGLASKTTRATVGHGDYPIYNLPLLWSAGVCLSQGHDVKFFDAQCEKADERAVVSQVTSFKPKFIVALLNLPSLASDLALLKEIKLKNQGSVIIAVGSVNQIYHRRILEESSVDYCVICEPEMIVGDLISKLIEGALCGSVAGVAFRRGGQLCVSEISSRTPDLPESPIPYQLLNIDKYRDHYFFPDEKVGFVFSSRGCPFSCAYYCPYPLAFGNRVRFRPPEAVVDELELLNKEHGVTKFIFRDQNFTINRAHAVELCRLVEERNLQIEWICETRFNLAKDKVLLATMAQAGCTRIHFGLESGDPEMFESVAKSGAKFCEIQEILEMVRSVGIEAHVHIIIGLPGETWHSVLSTARLIKKIGVKSVNISLMIPYVGTQLHEDVLRKGLARSLSPSHLGGSHVAVRTEKMRFIEIKLAQLLLRRQFEDLDMKKLIVRKAVQTVKLAFASTRRTG